MFGNETGGFGSEGAPTDWRPYKRCDEVINDGTSVELSLRGFPQDLTRLRPVGGARSKSRKLCSISTRLGGQHLCPSSSVNKNRFPLLQVIRLSLIARRYRKPLFSPQDRFLQLQTKCADRACPSSSTRTFPALALSVRPRLFQSASSRTASGASQARSQHAFYSNRSM